MKYLVRRQFGSKAERIIEANTPEEAEEKMLLEEPISDDFENIVWEKPDEAILMEGGV